MGSRPLRSSSDRYNQRVSIDDILPQFNGVKGKTKAADGAAKKPGSAAPPTTAAAAPSSAVRRHGQAHTVRALMALSGPSMGLSIPWADSSCAPPFSFTGSPAEGREGGFGPGIHQGERVQDGRDARAGGAVGPCPWVARTAAAGRRAGTGRGGLGASAARD